MLAIQQPSSNSKRKCTPNVLPCRINHNGAVDASKRYWNPQRSADGKTTAYFRGRKLHARNLKVPNGYRGVILTNTERVLAQVLDGSGIKREDEHHLDEEEEEEDEREEEVKIAEEQASFEEVMVWGHEVVADASEDCYIRAVEEWIGFAESIHSYDVDDGGERVTEEEGNIS